MSLLISMFPQIALVTPLFKIETAIGLFDTWPGLILPYITFALPLGIYTLSAFFREIPWELEKAAKMDGATPYQAFRKVIAPLAMPGVFTTAILVFIACWNDFLFAISLTSTNEARTVPGGDVLLHRRDHVREAHRRDRCGRGHHHHPHRHLRPVLPAPHRRWPHIGSGQGLRPATHELRSTSWQKSLWTTSSSAIPTGPWRSMTSAWRSPTASSSSWSGRPAAESRPCSTWWPGSRTSPRASCSIDGTVVNDKAPKDRDIAMVFQSYALYPHMTVGENMAFPLVLAGVDKGTIKTKVDEAAEMLELTAHLDRKPANLSGGQRQRVAMGRAIVRSPKAFLMDEPLSNLDAKLRVQMRTQVARIQKTLGTTTLYVTHDQTEAMTLGDRVVVLRGGVVQQVGSPTDLYQHPTNLFVAGFIGSPAMNFLAATIEGESLNCGLGKIAMPDRIRRAVDAPRAARSSSASVPSTSRTPRSWATPRVRR